MQKTNINYLTHTWNPIAMRCTRCSDGCQGCWHLRTADRLCKNKLLPACERLALAGLSPFILRSRELSAPLRTKKPCVIGVQFMGDLFHEDVPTTFIDDVFEIITACPQHTFLILTKRAHLMEGKIYGDDTIESFARVLGGGDYFPNVFWGLTVCNQQEADEKIPVFMGVPGFKWLSIEPMLSKIIIPFEYRKLLKGVVLGGETGPKARPMNPDWVRSVKDQCEQVGVDFFFKGWGSYFDKGVKKIYLSTDNNRLLDGVTHDALPWVKKCS